MNAARAWLRFPALVWLLLAMPGLLAQEAPIRIPTATPLLVELGKHVPMKKGEPLRGSLMYAVYAGNRLVIPAGSILCGSVVALRPDRGRRIHARLRGDFTPYRAPVVRFDRLILPDGIAKSISTDKATDGAPVLHLSATPRTSRSLFPRLFAQLKQRMKDTVSLVTAPGRKDRLVQLLYRQLPYHPQRIETGTMWAVTLAEPLELKPYQLPATAKAKPAETSIASRKRRSMSSSQTENAGDSQSAWRLDAYLEQTISSADEKRGNTFDAVVADPIFNRDHTLAVPQGSVLVGTITQAKPARSFGRAGKLRFDFRELKLPGAAARNVQGTLSAADSTKSQPLEIDMEGGVRPKPRSRVIVPLVLSVLAGRAFDEDGSVAGNTAVSSNGFGIVGRVVGVAAGSRNLAAGIGFYAAGLSFYERWLAHGKNVVFAKNTRIEVTTIPVQSPLPVGSPHQGTSKQRKSASTR